MWWTSCFWGGKTCSCSCYLHRKDGVVSCDWIPSGTTTCWQECLEAFKAAVRRWSLALPCRSQCELFSPVTPLPLVMLGPDSDVRSPAELSDTFLSGPAPLVCISWNECVFAQWTLRHPRRLSPTGSSMDSGLVFNNFYVFLRRIKRIRTPYPAASGTDFSLELSKHRCLLEASCNDTSSWSPSRNTLRRNVLEGPWMAMPASDVMWAHWLC